MAPYGRTYQRWNPKGELYKRASPIRVGVGVSALAIRETILVVEVGTPTHLRFFLLEGTAEFLSFEMASGKPYGHPTDVWAVGVICFMFLCGRLYLCSSSQCDDKFTLLTCYDSLSLSSLSVHRLPFDDPDRKENIDDNLENPNYSPLFNIIAKGVWEFRPEDEALSPNAKDFLVQLLDTNRDTRPTFRQAIDHPFLAPDGA